jgi:hypothetical protein
MPEFTLSASTNGREHTAHDVATMRVAGAFSYVDAVFIERVCARGYNRASVMTSFLWEVTFSRKTDGV